MPQEIDMIQQAHAARQDREQLQVALKGVGRTASEIRGVLERAKPDEQGLYDCLSATRGQLVELLRVQGVTLFGERGERIDASRHKVVDSGDETTDVPVITCVLVEGMEWRDRILRKAEVVASKATG